MMLIEQLPPDERRAFLDPLLAFLEHDQPTNNILWNDWSIAPVSGGGNNRLYHALHPAGDLAIKFTIRDDLERARREFVVLSALAALAPTIAPHALLLDNRSYIQPVVVQTWIDGPTAAIPPTDDNEWNFFVEHLVSIHRITLTVTDISLPRAVVEAREIHSGKQTIMQQIAAIPAPEQPSALLRLVRVLEKVPRPTWSPPQETLCRADPNCTNFIRRPNQWASIDWEYSGWSDPACELADVMTHPAYSAVPISRWEWFVETYCTIAGDPTIADRVSFYSQYLVVWWTARYARALYQTLQGIQRKLIEPKPGYADRARLKYEHYLERADRLL